MKVYVVAELSMTEPGIQNLEVFATAEGAAEAIRRLEWAEDIALAVEWGAVKENTAQALVSPDKKTILQVGLMPVEGVLLS